MRPIKFRIWNGKFLHYLSDLSYLSEWLVSNIEHYDSYKFDQFTGLHDKHGKEIYEGEILDTGHENIYFVEYKLDRFWLSKYVGIDYSHEGSSDGYYRICLASYSKASEIIGNIHSNPELLESNK